MNQRSNTFRSSRIENLEPLILMSGSALDADLMSVEGGDVTSESEGFGIPIDRSASTSDGSGEVLIGIPVEPNSGIGDGAVPIPFEEGTGESESPLEQPEYPSDPDILPGESGSSAGSIGSGEVLMAIPVEPDGGIGSGAGPIPIGEGVSESEDIPAEDLEFLTDPDDFPGEPGSSPGSEPIEGGERPPIEFEIVDAELVDSLPFETVSFDGTVTPTGDADSGDELTIPENRTLMLDHAMSITAAPAVGGGPEAQSGAAQDFVAVSDALVIASDPAASFPIEQPPTYTPTIEGTDAGEWITGTVGDDVIAAGGGDDEIHASSGDNFVDGGDGSDTFVVYEGFSDEYTIALRSDGVSSLEGPGLNGEDVRVDLFNVERIQFNDRTIDLSTITTVVANPPAGNPTIIGTDAGEWIGGTAADDTINAGAGDDEVYAALGENTIDGGDGDDTLVVYQGTQADYVLLNLGDGTIYLEGPGLNGETVRNYLSNVERILFTDGAILTSQIEDLVAPANTPMVNALAGDEVLMQASQEAVVVP